MYNNSNIISVIKNYSNIIDMSFYIYLLIILEISKNNKIKLS
jgi:hypothetical protein